MGLRQGRAKIDLLILAAFLPEIQGLRRFIRKQSAIRAEVTGIGLVNSAIGAAGLLERYHPGRVLFIGSVGAVNNRVAPFALITARSVVLKDQGELNRTAEILKGSSKKLLADRSLLQTIRGSDRSIVQADAYSTLAITRSAKVALGLGRGMLHPVESLELYGVACACAAADIPWASIQAVTNHVGSSGNKQWLRNHVTAARLTAEAIKKLL